MGILRRHGWCNQFKPGNTAINALTAADGTGRKNPHSFRTIGSDRQSAGFLALADRASAKVMRIRDTLSLETVEISEAFLKTAKAPVESGTAFGCGRDEV